MSSKHSKRISVFDRLGPGNDGEPSTSGASQPHHLPSRGHRHYSLDKPRNLPEERLRERKLSGSSRRHEPLAPGGVEALSKRERTSSLPSRNLRHSELDKGNEDEEKRRSLRHSRKPKGKEVSARGIETEEERREFVDRVREDEGRRRKRDRFSMGDSELGYPESKRSRDEPVGEQRHHDSRRGAAGRDVDDKGRPSDAFPHRLQPGSRHRSGQERATPSEVPIETDSESQCQLEAIQYPDWTTLGTMRLPQLALSVGSCVKKFSAGSVLVRVGLSSQLAGLALAGRAKQAAMGHVQDLLAGSPQYGDVQQWLWGDTVCQLALSRFSQFREQAGLVELMRSVQPCRKSLTASADFALRKKLLASKKAHIPSVTSDSSLDSEFYRASLCLYHQSAASSKNRRFPVRVESSLIGSVLVQR